MLAAAKAGNTAEVHAIMQRLRRLLADESATSDGDDHLDPSTLELFEDLSGQGLHGAPTVDSVHCE